MTDNPAPLPLSTQEGIDLCYPEHAKMRANKVAIDAVERFIHSIGSDNGDHRICKRGYDEVYDEELEENVTVERWQPLSSYEWDWRKQVFPLFGIDIDAWWKEKDSMIEQLRMAQGYNADGSKSNPV